MKRVLIVVLLSMINFYASSKAELTPVGNLIEWQIRPTNPVIGGHPMPKSPIEPPTVSLDDHTLYIYDVDYGFTLYLLDENDTVVYSTFVAANATSVNLPATLTGDYVLQLVPGGDYYFEGEIEL